MGGGRISPDPEWMGLCLPSVRETVGTDQTAAVMSHLFTKQYIVPVVGVVALFLYQPQNPVMPGGDLPDEIFDLGRGIATLMIGAYFTLQVLDAVQRRVRKQPSEGTMGDVARRLEEMGTKFGALERNASEVRQVLFGPAGVPTSLTLMSRVDGVHEKLNDLHRQWLKMEETMEDVDRRLREVERTMERRGQPRSD